LIAEVDPRNEIRQRSHGARNALLTLIFGASLYPLNTLLTNFFGVGVVGTAMDILILAFVCGIGAALLLVPFLLARNIYVRERMRRTGYFPKRSLETWKLYLGTAIPLFLIFAVPHLWMSHRLAPLKMQFERVANGGESGIVFTGQYNDGRAVNEADFGGKLDGIVETRTVVLMKYNFIPLPLGGWKYKPGYWSSYYMGYIYSFLPQSVYRNILLRSLKPEYASLPKAEQEKLRQEINAEFQKLPY